MLLDDETGQPLVDLTKFGRDRPLPPPNEEDADAVPSKFAPIRAGQLKTWTLQSGAYGVNNFSVINTPGMPPWVPVSAWERSLL